MEESELDSERLSIKNKSRFCLFLYAYNSPSVISKLFICVSSCVSIITFIGMPNDRHTLQMVKLRNDDRKGSKSVQLNMPTYISSEVQLVSLHVTMR